MGKNNNRGNRMLAFPRGLLCMICLTICCPPPPLPYSEAQASSTNPPRSPSRRLDDDLDLRTPCPPRPRPLTPRSDDPHNELFASPQTQSLFFTKLPAELRRLVYEKVLGRGSIHLRIDGKLSRLLVKRCPEPVCRHEYFGYNECRMESRLDVWLDLLKTCRRMYSEAIETLYSNQFCISTEFQLPLILRYLPHFLPLESLCKIRHLYLYWEASPFMEAQQARKRWLDSWAVLQQMSGLYTLYIKFARWQSASIGRRWVENQVMMFEPIKCVTSPETFIIVLPGEGISVDVGQSGCIFRLPDDA